MTGGNCRSCRIDFRSLRASRICPFAPNNATVAMIASASVDQAVSASMGISFIDARTLAPWCDRFGLAACRCCQRRQTDPRRLAHAWVGAVIRDGCSGTIVL